MRIDKWLWAVRIFKSRSMATDACKKGHVLINGQVVKASREVKVEDKIEFQKDYHKLVLEVIDLPASRVSAKLAPDYVLRISSDENPPS